MDTINIHSTELKGRKMLFPVCSWGPKRWDPCCVAPGQELSYLTEQIKIRSSYLCLTALHVPEGDRSLDLVLVLFDSESKGQRPKGLPSRMLSFTIPLIDFSQIISRNHWPFQLSMAYIGQLNQFCGPIKTQREKPRLKVFSSCKTDSLSSQKTCDKCVKHVTCFCSITKLARSNSKRRCCGWTAGKVTIMRR